MYNLMYDKSMQAEGIYVTCKLQELLYIHVLVN